MAEVTKDEDVVTPEEEVEEVVEEAAEEAEGEKLIESIAEKVAQVIESKQKVSKEVAEKKEAVLGGEVKASKKELVVGHRKDGEELKVNLDEAKAFNKWFKHFMHRDISSANKLADQMNKWRPLTEGTNSEGGFLVPTVLSSTIIPLLEDATVVRPRATTIDMSGMGTNTLSLNGINSKPTVSWTGENVDKSTTSMTFSQISLTPYKLAAILSLSMELLEDAPVGLIGLVSQAFAESIAKEEDRVFMLGDGSGQPTGIDNYTLPSLDAGGALAFSHLESAYWGLPQAYRGPAVWIMNSRTIAAISSLVDSNNRPLLEQSGILTTPGVPALKGKPVLEQNDVASDKIFFGDLRQYYIATKGGLRIDTSDQATVASVSAFERNVVHVRAEERLDGELTTTRAFYEITNTGVS